MLVKKPEDDDYVSAEAFFEADRDYHKARAEFAIARMGMLVSCHPRAVQTLYDEAIQLLKDNE